MYPAPPLFTWSTWSQHRLFCHGPSSPFVSNRRSSAHRHEHGSFLDHLFARWMHTLRSSARRSTRCKLCDVLRNTFEAFCTATKMETSKRPSRGRPHLKQTSTDPDEDSTENLRWSSALIEDNADVRASGQRMRRGRVSDQQWILCGSCPDGVGSPLDSRMFPFERADVSLSKGKRFPFDWENEPRSWS